jgi:transcriptional regulator with XRE-family HTH domain
MAEQAIEGFARAVGGLKERSGLSYGALAKRLHLSTSTLHRYCSGSAVPVDYAPVERLARVCGASPAELVDLHRLWVLADVARNRSREQDPAPARSTAAASAPSTPAPDNPQSSGEPSPAEPSPADPSAGRLADRPGELAAGPPDAPRRRLGRPVTAGLAMVLLAVAATVAVQLWGDEPSTPPGQGGAPGPAESSPTAEAGPPVDWTVRSHLWENACGQPYLVDREPADVPEPPPAQDAEEWAGDLDAVYGRTRVVEATLRTNGPTPVTIDAVHVRLADRAEPLPWNVYNTNPGCGGALTVAKFAVDLDEQRPRPVATEGFDGETMETLAAPLLPYQITPADPLLLRMEATTATCDCTWYLEVDWSSRTDQGTLRIDDGGRPFRVSAVVGNTPYAYDTSWVVDPQ